MKKFTKTISIILAVIMTFSIVVPAFAADVQSVTYPEIYVHGFATGSIYNNVDGEAELITIPDKDSLLAMVKDDVVPAVLKFAADGDAKQLGTTISDLINTTFADWFNNPDGSPANNSGVNFVYPSASSVKNTSRLYFRYDWRGNPIEIAAQLNDYINYVLKCTGKEKVALSAHSLGTVLVLTYISIYGSDKVMGILFDSPAINGVSIVGELFCGNPRLGAGAVETLFKMFIGETEYEELLASIIDIFAMAGVNASIAELINSAYDEIGVVLMEKTIFPLFGSWLSVWTMIPDDYIDEAMRYSFDSGVYPEEYDALRIKVQEYNEKVRKDKNQTLLDFDKVGRVSVISRYGFSAVPMAEDRALISDGLIETSNTSLGATTAYFGDSFSDEYLADKDMKYISPDKSIDASTCLFPEKTWFIKDLDHHDPYVAKKYYKQLLFDAEEATCENSSLARFMLYDEESGELVEDNTEPVKTEKLTVLQRVFNFVKALINKLLELLGK